MQDTLQDQRALNSSLKKPAFFAASLLWFPLDFRIAALPSSVAFHASTTAFFASRTAAVASASSWLLAILSSTSRELPLSAWLSSWPKSELKRFSCPARRTAAAGYGGEGGENVRRGRV